MNAATVLPNLGTLLQRFFIEYLMEQRHASPQTIAAYGDSFRLLLAFAERAFRPAKRRSVRGSRSRTARGA